MPNGQADRPRLADVEAEPGAPATFAVERQSRVFVEQIVHVGDDFEAAVELEPGREIDQIIGRQLEVERRRGSGWHAVERIKVVDEGPRIILLVRRLRVAAADVLVHRRHIPIGIGVEPLAVGRRSRHLELRHARQAVAFTDSGSRRQRLRKRRVELGLEDGAGDGQVEARDRRGSDFRLDAPGVRLGHVEDDTG